MTNPFDVVLYLEKIINHALNKKASDIHIEIYEHHCCIRFRIDGILHEEDRPDREVFELIISRVKILSQLNIAEKRLPQDGHFIFASELSKPINIRTSIIPTTFGEKAVLRLLEGELKIRDIDHLGFNQQQKQDFFEAISKPQGLILVTGPTGSGKTVTLYAALNYLNSGEKNISTVEDPIEINFSGINQTAVHHKIGLSFASTLRSLLRQDPDIMMIGEIRDTETAEIAIKAAQTGHLVLSTLHTNSALESIGRLHYMGLAPYLIADSVQLITAQRLVRQLCDHCKKAYQPSIIEQEQYKLSQDAMLYRPEGCSSCHKGYIGRIAIHEVYSIDDSIRLWILNNQQACLKNMLQEKNIPTLSNQAMEKVLTGQTSLEEIKRVIGI